MKKILHLVIMFTLILIICGCSSNENVQSTNKSLDEYLEKNKPKPQMTGFFSVKGTEGEDDGIIVESENFSGDGSSCLVQINEGEFLLVDSKIKIGYIEIKIGDEIYYFDKTQKFLIDVPKNELRNLPALGGDFVSISLTPYDKFTGIVILKSSPKN